MMARDGTTLTPEETMMVSAQRMQQLEAFVVFWRDQLSRAKAQLDHLLQAKRNGLIFTNEAGEDILPDRIAQEDVAVREYHKGLIAAEAALARAKAGYDD